MSHLRRTSSTLTSLWCLTDVTLSPELFNHHPFGFHLRSKITPKFIDTTTTSTTTRRGDSPTFIRWWSFDFKCDSMTQILGSGEKVAQNYFQKPPNLENVISCNLKSSWINLQIPHRKLKMNFLILKILTTVYSCYLELPTTKIQLLLS